MSGSTEHRKADHIEIVLEKDVAAKGVTTGFERFFLEHCALPDLNLEDVDLSLTLWQKSLKAPLLISSMTGGTDIALKINLHLAVVAQALGLAMGVGSQRAAIEKPELVATYQVRKVAPDILLFANLGAVQLNYGYGLEEAKRAVEMIEADALILHLNPLQEAVQPGGDRSWQGLSPKIEQLTQKLVYPATYAARESTKHRNLAHQRETAAVELVSIEPFIELLDDAKKQEIKEKLTEKYFGNGHNQPAQTETNTQESLPIDIIERIIKMTRFPS